MSEIRLCNVVKVEEGQPLQVTVNGHDPFAVYNVGGQIYVSDDFCTHGKASLSDEGDLDGFTIICTWHDGAFDIRTGEVKSRPCTEALKIYPVIIRNGEILITVD
jgi:nitrite reductase/ring-hydroxylating ferredoxin subunit